MMHRIRQPFLATHRTSSFRWMQSSTDLFTPSTEHKALREILAGFVKSKVDPQALKHDREEKFNIELFRELGDLGLLGITAPEKFVLYL
ncbi:hypothetical protein PsorP6_008797 [Peronosclerospora sorghi]|uniref:Uncharacterized protein n=1 Tax=Peronosclerospora sorghi TaxID=230839 RepID=A0ACC0W1W2_9STRA|nr:hypothetical protein PsorP6_008797 [Peronosclerospora sorghi]